MGLPTTQVTLRSAKRTRRGDGTSVLGSVWWAAARRAGSRPAPWLRSTRDIASSQVGALPWWSSGEFAANNLLGHLCAVARVGGVNQAVACGTTSGQPSRTTRKSGKAAVVAVLPRCFL